MTVLIVLIALFVCVHGALFLSSLNHPKTASSDDRAPVKSLDPIDPNDARWLEQMTSSTEVSEYSRMTGNLASEEPFANAGTPQLVSFDER